MPQGVTPPPSSDALQGVSDANVEGYLRNVAARAAHFAAGEGGRGTKVHRGAAVTWNETQSRLKLGSASDAAKAEPTASREDAAAAEVSLVPSEDSDEWEVVLVAASDERKESSALVETKDHHRNEDSSTLQNDPRPSRVEEPRNELWEMREAAKAKRSMEKNATFAKCVVGFTLLVHQLHSIFRQAHRPALAASLLSMAELRTAVEKAQSLLYRTAADKKNEGNPAPAWVNALRDGAGTRTGAAAHCLITAINATFAACEQPPLPESTEEGLPRSPHKIGHRFDTTLNPSDNASLGTVGFCEVFLALARVTGFESRLCVAFALDDIAVAEAALEGADEAMGYFPREPKRKTAVPVAKRKTETSFWCEAWCEVKRCFISINPCQSVTPRWGAPHVLAHGGDHTADVAPRYCSAWSKIYKGRIEEVPHTRGFLWAAEMSEETQHRRVVHAYESPSRKSDTQIPLRDKNPLQRLLWPLCTDVSERTFDRLTIEEQHLAALKYSEPLPTKLTELKGHPLFVLEADVTRYEGIYPKDATTTVGYIKGRPVYRRDALRPLRSRMGWLRVGREVPDDASPYKIPPPPPNRPLMAPLQLFGYWQTIPFQPRPVDPDGGTVPRHPGTSWYMLLDAPKPGAGLALLRGPGLESVARRIHCEFALALTGFEKRTGPQLARGRWVPVFSGIVVAEGTVPSLSRAYAEWLEIKRAKDAASRRTRALQWWKRLIGLGLSRQRVSLAYLNSPP